MTESGIAERFSAGAECYDVNASVQYGMAETFARWLDESGNDADTATNDGSNRPAAYSSAFTNDRASPVRITELGCGTGFLTERIRQRFPSARVDACDISTEMLTQCHIRNQGMVTLHQADAATFTTGQPCDWIVSSFCLQWLDQLRAVLAFHASQTRRLSVCVPCSGSFADWRQAHETHGVHAALWPLPSAVELTQWMQEIADSRGGILRSRLEMVPEHHDSPLAFARHLRAIGADYTGAKGAGIAFRRVLEVLPAPYIAWYEVLMVDLIPGEQR